MLLCFVLATPGVVLLSVLLVFQVFSFQSAKIPHKLLLCFWSTAQRCQQEIRMYPRCGSEKNSHRHRCHLKASPTKVRPPMFGSIKIIVPKPFWC